MEVDFNNNVDNIVKYVYQYFVDSSDFNGVPLRSISEKFRIDYKESIDLIIIAVQNGDISIQRSTNPHIIGLNHYEVEIQIQRLNEAKNSTVTYKEFAGLRMQIENSDFSICLYPSQSYLTTHRNLNLFGDAYYTKELAIGSPQLSLRYFHIEVLERYTIDPRYDFRFQNYSGSIYCHYDNTEKPLVREEEEVFLKSFGLGYGENGERLAVATLRYLKDLSEDQQMYWKSKKYNGKGKVVEAYFENIILGNWTNDYSVFTAFIGEQQCLNKLSEIIYGKPLFHNVYDESNCPKEFSPFFSPTYKNYLDFVSLLDKMLSDNINKDFFNGKIEVEETRKAKDGSVEKIPKGTIRLFEEWFTLEAIGSNQNGIKMLFGEFKNVRRERQIPAHKITVNDYDLKYYDMQLDMINRCYHATKALRHFFASHPKAEGFVVPTWLDKGRIQKF